MRLVGDDFWGVMILIGGSMFENGFCLQLVFGK